jgi:hypothetical protein
MYLEVRSGISMMSQDLATVLLRKTLDDLELVTDRLLNRSWSLHIWIDLMEHAENEFADLWIASHSFACSPSQLITKP